MQYQFGDSDLAARRLAVLADTFADSTASFLRQAVRRPTSLAIDLGSGPGHTTHLLADTLDADRTVGLDNSDSFLALARRTETPGVSFRLHDVTTVPFPTANADVAFCRFLLAHLPDAESLAHRWTTQLCPGGLLLMEEVEWIRTSQDAFHTYLAIVEAMLADHGSIFCVGPALDAFGARNGVTRHCSDVRPLRVGNSRAARMFHMNIQTWKHRPYVQANVPVEQVEELQERLRHIANSGDGRSDIEWGLRQIALQRTEE